MFKRRLYIKNNLDPFPISRTKIDLFFECKRCFYLDLKFGIKRPHGTPLVINNRIIEQIKKEFDFFREKNMVHPEILNLKRNLIPIKHNKLIEWKNSFKGIRFTEKKTNLQFYGTIDDLWLDTENNKKICVIYKSTSKKEALDITNVWPGYWKQLSFYSYLLKKNNVDISSNGLILYINASNELDSQNSELKFDFYLFEKILDFSWIEKTIYEIYELLNNENIPDCNEKCKFCNYFKNIKNKLDEKS